LRAIALPTRSERMANDLVQQGVKMNIHVAIGPLVALIAGILILVVPRLLNYIVALYLIIIGIIGLFGTGGHF
jgi:malate synthase